MKASPPKEESERQRRRERTERVQTADRARAPLLAPVLLFRAEAPVFSLRHGAPLPQTHSRGLWDGRKGYSTLQMQRRPIISG